MYSAVIVGSGFSGICMAITLKANDIHDFIIIEKADNIGGTWRENTYPGAECDIPSALYSFSFEPYPDWEYKWSHQPQILDYISHCYAKYKLEEHTHLNKELTSAHWQEDHWMINTKDGDHYKAKFFIPALGQLHHISMPNIEGIDIFQGASYHSAKWDHSVSLKGKAVGVIGNAASAVQFIPQIAKEAKKVVVFQRTPNWMLPKQDRMYKQWEKNLVRRFPIFLKMYRNRIWLLGGALFLLMKTGNDFLRKTYEKKTQQFIRRHIKDEDIVQKLIPNYPLGAKRVLFSDDYYEALAKEHVQLETESIEAIDKTGIVTKQKGKHELDVIIYATGFKTNPFLMNLDIKGKEDISIHKHWQDGPKNYLGMTVDQFPNMFLMYGPNTNLGHNSIILMSEAQSKYIVQCITHLEKNNNKVLEIKSSAISKYYEEIQARLKKMIWSKIDHSWYQSPNGNIPNNWPGRTMEYTRRTKKVVFDDYNIS